MDTALASALAALAGSAIGGFASFSSSWIGLHQQIRSQGVMASKQRREELYREFILEASSLYIDALTRDTPVLSKTIILYALISRMRVLSSDKVIEEAEKVARQIIELYPQPNKTFADVQAMSKAKTFDPLNAFAHACRDELGVR
jgi:hypothetical protein